MSVSVSVRAGFVPKRLQHLCDVWRRGEPSGPDVWAKREAAVCQVTRFPRGARAQVVLKEQLRVRGASPAVHRYVTNTGRNRPHVRL